MRKGSLFRSDRSIVNVVDGSHGRCRVTVWSRAEHPELRAFLVLGRHALATCAVDSEPCKDDTPDDAAAARS